jgi:hypothetical protein
MPEVALDNDILIKCSCYGLLDELSSCLADGPLGVLGAARYVVSTALRRSPRTSSLAVLASFEAFLAHVVELEPTEDEIALATTIEEAALAAAMPLDAGESQLCAIVIRRAFALLVTGDKRAIAAAERLVHAVPALTALAGRVTCLEQLIAALVEQHGYDEIATKVRSVPDCDKALASCFGRTAVAAKADALAGLDSYIRAIRADAPTLLADATP